MITKAHYIDKASCTNYPRSPSALPGFSFTKYKLHICFLKSLSRPMSVHPIGLYCRARFVSDIVSSLQIVPFSHRAYIQLRAVMLKMRSFVDATTFLLLNRNKCRILEEAYSIPHNMPEDSKLPNVYFLPHNNLFHVVF